jgi:BolA-like protein 1
MSFRALAGQSVERPRTRRSLRVLAAAEATSLPAGLRRIVGAFQAVPDPMLRYKQLLFYASKLKPLPEALRCAENKVQGCVSQVWVSPELREGVVFFQADSDSQLTKARSACLGGRLSADLRSQGLAALLVEGLSGSTPAEIASVTPDFIEQLGLKQSLTPSRNNG